MYQAIGRQLSNPSGLGGIIAAAVMRVANRRPTRELIRALDVCSHHRVLDVGCGDGSTLASLHHAAWRSGVDRSGTMVAMASRRLRRGIRTGHVAIELGDFQHLPFASASFDRIIASNILYFCDDVPAFIDECRRIARPDAVLGIYVTAAESMAGWRFAGPQTHRHFTAVDLHQEFDRAGVAHADRDVIGVSLPGQIQGLVALVQLAPLT